MDKHKVSPDLLMTTTADIVASHVSNNAVAVRDMSGLIASVHASLSGLVAVDEQKPEPAVSIRASVKKDEIVCLVCGGRFQGLKKHISIAHGLSPEEYREQFDLKSSYPMIASDLAQSLSEKAKARGLGKRTALDRKKKKTA